MFKKYIQVAVFGMSAIQAQAAPENLVPENLVIDTSVGPVKGHLAGESHVFKGIRYGQAPVGKLRWQPPLPVKRSTSIYNAKEYGAECPQLEMKFRRTWDSMTGSEDCLFLNVWKPVEGERLPVLFFIHGGAQIMGSSSSNFRGYYMYDGGNLALDGPAIVVTVNYRLGALGFMAHPALSKEQGGGSGNYGIMDLILALKWVQENAEAFGGDPDRVMVFGESAGAINTLVLLASPLAKGLFSRAIIQSGLNSAAPLPQAEQMGVKISELVKCRPSGPSMPKRPSQPSLEEELECLQKKSALEFVKGIRFEKYGMQGIFLEPTIDGKVLHDHPLGEMERPGFEPVPVIIGTNRDEASLLNMVFNWDLLVTPSDYKKFLREMFGEEKGEMIQAVYPPWKNGTPKNTLQNLLSDSLFHCPARRIARALNARHYSRKTEETPSVWRYVFTHTPKNIMALFGPTHAIELFYVFQNFPNSIFFPKLGSERKFAHNVAKFWLDFAALAELNPKEWKSYDSQKDTYLDLSTDMKNKAGFRPEECNFWDKNQFAQLHLY